MSKNKTDWSDDTTKQKTSFSEISRNKTAFSESAKNKTDFSDITKNKTDFLETGEGSSSSITPTFDDSRVVFDEAECQFDGDFTSYSWTTSRKKTTWTE